MENNKPLVSVIVPTYNREDKILISIKSILSQTYKNIEIIVVNDNSNDYTEDTILNFIKSSMLEQKIIYIKNKSNLGNAGSRNVGIKKAKGEYISFLDDDDEWLKSKIEKQICLIKKSNLHVCFCGTYWKENNTVIKKSITKSNMVSFENGGPTSTWLIHRSVFDTIGLFDENFPSNVDGEFLVRLNKKFVSCFVEEYLYIHHYYDNQITSSNRNKIIGFEKLISKHYDILNPYELSSAYFKLCIFYLLNGDKNYLYIKNSLVNKLCFNNVLLLLVMLIPSVTISKILLNKILDMLNYPISFAGRYG